MHGLKRFQKFGSLPLPKFDSTNHHACLVMGDSAQEASQRHIPRPVNLPVGGYGLSEYSRSSSELPSNPSSTPLTLHDSSATPSLILPCDYCSLCDGWLNNSGASLVSNPKWGAVVDALIRVKLKSIQSISQLEDAINKYNRNFGGLSVLKYLIEKEHNRQFSFNSFCDVLLPKLIDLALELPTLFPQPFPLLVSGHPCSVTLSQRQVGSLLANAFLCTFTCEHRGALFKGLIRESNTPSTSAHPNPSISADPSDAESASSTRPTSSSMDLDEQQKSNRHVHKTQSTIEHFFPGKSSSGFGGPSLPPSKKQLPTSPKRPSSSSPPSGSRETINASEAIASKNSTSKLRTKTDSLSSLDSQLIPPAIRSTRPPIQKIVPLKYDNFPIFDFCMLLNSGFGKAFGVKLEKLKCLLNYFSNILSQSPVGAITVERRVLFSSQASFAASASNSASSLSASSLTAPRAIEPDWYKSTVPLCKLRVTIDSENRIEDALGFMQADFANAYYGGGVLNTGCVQEEILLMLYPESLVGILLCERMSDREAILIHGARRFSSYTGYAWTFKYAGPYSENPDFWHQRDAWGRHHSCIFAVDAIPLKRNNNQFSPDCVLRELSKFYCGIFQCNNVSSDSASASVGSSSSALSSMRTSAEVGVATGNWGCGAFGGDKYLKAVEQLLAFAQAGRELPYELAYFTFGDRGLFEEIESFLSALGKLVQTPGRMPLSVGQCLHLLDQYYQRLPGRRNAPNVLRYLTEEINKLCIY